MEARSTSSISVDRLVRLFNTSFQGYVSWSKDFTAETLIAWCERSLVSLDRGYVFFQSSSAATSDPESVKDREEPVAFGLIAEREDRPGCVRLAAMGVALGVQGQGVGSQAIALIIQRERERGTKLMDLECVWDNERALKLYKKAGFEVSRQLSGWERDPVSPHPGGQFGGEDGLEECTVQEVDALVKKHAGDDLPWQAGFVSKLTAAKRAFKLGHAYCAISDPGKDGDTIKVASLIVEPEFRGNGEGTRLARAVLGSFEGKGKKWFVHLIYPKEFGEGIAGKIGARETHTNQVQMRMKL